MPKKPKKRHTGVWARKSFTISESDLKRLMAYIGSIEEIDNDHRAKELRDGLERIIGFNYLGMLEALDKKPSSAAVKKELDDLIKNTDVLIDILNNLNDESLDLLGDRKVDTNAIKKQLVYMSDQAFVEWRDRLDGPVGRPKKQALKRIVINLADLFYKINQFESIYGTSCSKEEARRFIQAATALDPSIPTPSRDMILKCLELIQTSKNS